MPRTGTTIGEVVGAYWPILVVSFTISLAATPICRRAALRLRIVDRPDDFLKPHRHPVPYLGGVAIYLGWLAGIVTALLLFHRGGLPPEGTRSGPTLDLRMTLGILAAGTLTMGLGLFDDLRMASPKGKLVGLTVVAGFLMVCGLGHDSILVFLRSMGVRLSGLQDWLVLIYSVPLTLLIVLGACNATNLIDGLDGLCSGVLAIIAAGFLVLSVHLHLWNRWDPLDAERVVLSLAIMGAAIGFLPFNRNPAKIFMGDAGSMLLGLNAAVVILLFSKSTAMRWMLASLMVFGLPIADTLMTLVRRWRNGRPIMQGDRSHFYDQLIDRGWPVRGVVRTSYALAAFFALMGCASITLRTRYILPLYALVAVGTAYLIGRFDMVRLETRDAEHKTGNVP